MTNAERQRQLDEAKWLESEKKGYDVCGEFDYCAKCDKSSENPCATAEAATIAKATTKKTEAKKATTAKKAPAKKTTTKKTAQKA